MKSKRGRFFGLQLGQSMAEYTVVMAALVGGLLVANKGACPSEYEDCVEYLLTTMHDNYDGYSASLSAVQEYATDYEVSKRNDSWESGDGEDNDDENGGPTDGTDINTGGLPVGAGTAIGNGTDVYGSWDSSTGEVINNGEVVGIYDSSTGQFTATDGTTEAVIASDVIVDQDGNILERQAVQDCATGEIYAFGYRSEADGGFYDSLQYKEMDVTGYCTATSYKVEDANGNEDGGRIVDGFYYAVTTIYQPAESAMEPQGEVVYFSDPNQDGNTDDATCVVMAAGWDSGLDPDDDDYFTNQLELLNNPPNGESLVIGYQDPDNYTEQLMQNNEPPAPNSCVSNREITEP